MVSNVGTVPVPFSIPQWFGRYHRNGITNRREYLSIEYFEFERDFIENHLAEYVPATHLAVSTTNTIKV